MSNNKQKTSKKEILKQYKHSILIKFSTSRKFLKDWLIAIGLVL